jgi:hypothetical protein
MRVTVAQQAPVASANVTRARASVSIVVPVVESSAVLLAASATSVVAQAAVAVQTIVTANSYILLTSSAVLDTSGLYSYKTDIAVVTDTSFRVVGKTLTDTFGQTDYITNLNTALAKHDSVSTPDFVIRTLEFIRRFTDTFGFTHRVSFTFSRPLHDNFALGDTTARNFSKARVNSVAVSDTNPILSTDKYRANSFTAVDTMSRFFTKARTDSFGLVDSKSFLLARPAVDSFTFTDSTRLTPTKVLADSFTQADAVTRAFNKARTDSFTLPDTMTRSSVKSLQDSFNQADSNTKAVNKVLADAFAFTELLSRSLNRTIQDGFAMNDTADLADGITYQTVKYVNNLAFVTDAKVLSSSLRKTDSVSLVSAGLLTSQSYCDLSYFAEDYVGISRTFS